MFSGEKEAINKGKYILQHWNDLKLFWGMELKINSFFPFFLVSRIIIQNRFLFESMNYITMGALHIIYYGKIVNEVTCRRLSSQVLLVMVIENDRRLD